LQINPTRSGSHSSFSSAEKADPEITSAGLLSYGKALRRELLGVPIDSLTFDETVSSAVEAMRAKRLTQHVAINVAKLVKARRDPELWRDIAESHIVGIDGMGVVWASRALGIPVPERVAGVDLMERLLEICGEKGFRPYFLGASQEVLHRAVAAARTRWPGLDFAGYRDGYFAADDEWDIVTAIRISGADCLFIGMPTPQKERFLHSYRDLLNVPFIMGVGGGIDVLAGHVRRAPAFMQRTGLEWLYRIYQEPGRMWWRYASTNAQFAGLVAKALIARAVSGRSRADKLGAEGRL
jgi:N-acetylglucosaminyldiphosphoundecaprenol N-acetyl-beta-D-mannosaminyltransferase